MIATTMWIYSQNGLVKKERAVLISVNISIGRYNGMKTEATRLATAASTVDGWLSKRDPAASRTQVVLHWAIRSRAFMSRSVTAQPVEELAERPDRAGAIKRPGEPPPDRQTTGPSVGPAAPNSHYAVYGRRPTTNESLSSAAATDWRHGVCQARSTRTADSDWWLDCLVDNIWMRNMARVSRLLSPSPSLENDGILLHLSSIIIL